MIKKTENSIPNTSIYKSNAFGDRSNAFGDRSNAFSDRSNAFSG
jgi:hypothetical protein